MVPTLAPVLNTLAHEIRTPLAVSRGYLKLLLEGALPSPAEQRAALERTREALGTVATLCDEMSRVGALADAEQPALGGRMSVRDLTEALEAAMAGDGPAWRGSSESERSVATNGTGDIVHAVAALARMAFKDAGGGRGVVEIATPTDSSLTLLIGGESAVQALPRHPDDEGAVEVPVVRGGFGLSLIWAAFVLRHHRVRTWHHSSGRGAVGLLFPLVN